MKRVRTQRKFWHCNADNGLNFLSILLLRRFEKCKVAFHIGVFHNISSDLYGE